jgi:hypothetical protein
MWNPVFCNEEQFVFFYKVRIYGGTGDKIYCRPADFLYDIFVT